MIGVYLKYSPPSAELASSKILLVLSGVQVSGGGILYS